MKINAKFRSAYESLVPADQTLICVMLYSLATKDQEIRNAAKAINELLDMQVVEKGKE